MKNSWSYRTEIESSCVFSTHATMLLFNSGLHIAADIHINCECRMSYESYQAFRANKKTDRKRVNRSSENV